MHFTEVFIRRPVATTILTLGLFLARAFAFPLLPVAPLPPVDFPTISVHAAINPYGIGLKDVRAALASANALNSHPWLILVVLVSVDLVLGILYTTRVVYLYLDRFRPWCRGGGSSRHRGPASGPRSWFRPALRIWSPRRQPWPADPRLKPWTPAGRRRGWLEP